MNSSNRRDFIKQASTLLGVSLSASLTANLTGLSVAEAAEKKSGLKLGLCTYLWGKDDDLPTLLRKCEQSKLTGLELRVEHQHKVEPELSPAQRKEVKKRFADSPVTLVGFGTNEDFHWTDQTRVRARLERAKEYVRLSADCGGSGVKVKPNDLPKGIAQEKTTAQIAAALNELGRFAADLGQEIRLENHGGCADIPVMKEIIDQVTEKNVGLCWNCNHKFDMKGPGFVANFKSVQKRLAHTIHAHEIPDSTYPYGEMIRLLLEGKYEGWILLECHKKIDDNLRGMIEQRKRYQDLINSFI